MRPRETDQSRTFSIAPRQVAPRKKGRPGVVKARKCSRRSAFDGIADHGAVEGVLEGKVQLGQDHGDISGFQDPPGIAREEQAVRTAKHDVGDKPLAQLGMVFFITLGVSFRIVTGMALYAEGAQKGSLADTLFGWVHSLTWTSQRLHSLHHLGLWWIVIFMTVHVHVAIREDIMSRQSIVSTMISGTRTFKDDRPD